MATKHTPGPWQVVEDREGHNPDIAIDADGWGIVADIGGGPLRVRRANARLIAAAPELLAVCERLHRALLKFGPTDVAVEAAMDIALEKISKAKGRL